MFSSSTNVYNFNNNTNIGQGGTCSIVQNITYTIETHLESFRDDPNYKVLYGCWQVDKKIYENRLKNINMRYQTYSMHDSSHSEAILRQIAYFLGEDRIKQLSPTDTWLILECAYSHDLGMVVTAKDIYKKFSSMDKDELKEYARKIYSNENHDIQVAWSYLELMFKFRKDFENFEDGENNYLELEIFKTAENFKSISNLMDIFHSKWYEWPMYFSRAFMILIQEECRPDHAKMSSDKLKNEANERTYEDVIPVRLRYLIADIAAMHGDYRENIIKKLSHAIQGYYSDYAHPRFVAELIRIGDLLDMDNNRFNTYQLAVVGKPGYNTFIHCMKHKALRNFLITPQKVIVEADFQTKDAEELFHEFSIQDIFDDDKYHKQQKNKNEQEFKQNQNNNEKDCRQEQSDLIAVLLLKAFKELSNWLGMLRGEMEFFSVNWLSIVPEGLIGCCPIFEPELLLIDGKEKDPNLMELKYHITARRASEIIEGSSLYNNLFQAFVREILQNALDATKRRIYTDLLKRNLAEPKNPLSFYRYLSLIVEDISINIKCFTSDKDEIKFLIRDKGTGITRKRMECMQHIGNAYDYDVRIQAEEMPKWWKPTGSFGIGMQTIFYFSKTFTLKTRTEEDGILKKMKFNSTRNGGKIDTYSINDEDDARNFGYGTEIKICISKNTLDVLQIQLASKKYDIDYFSDHLSTYEKNITNAISNIYGSFGIPITLDDQSIIKPECFLRRCFGKWFFDLDNGPKAEEVCDSSLEELQNNEYQGFSCWSSDGILIRYRKATDNIHTSLKVYFNEICVDDTELQKYLHIPFFETEAYIFDNEAENYLEINRDGFLNEKRRKIAEKICHVHLQCMSFLLEQTDSETFINYIWEDYENGISYSEVKKYLNYALYKKEMPVYVGINIKQFIQENEYIRRPDLAELKVLSKMSLFSEVWFTDIRNKYIGHIRLKKPESKARYIIEDVLYDYTELSINEMLCMEELYDDYFVIYKLSGRNGKPIKIDDNSFKAYIRYKFNEYLNSDRIDNRMILPGVEKFRCLCVNRLIENIGTNFEKRFDSYIILPFTVREIYKLLKQENSEKSIREYFENDNVYKKIEKYISKYRISTGIDFYEKIVMNSYIKLIIYIMEVLK